MWWCACGIKCSPCAPMPACGATTALTCVLACIAAVSIKSTGVAADAVAPDFSWGDTASRALLASRPASTLPCPRFAGTARTRCGAIGDVFGLVFFVLGTADTCGRSCPPGVITDNDTAAGTGLPAAGAPPPPSPRSPRSPSERASVTTATGAAFAGSPGDTAAVLPAAIAGCSGAPNTLVGCVAGSVSVGTAFTAVTALGGAAEA